MKLLPGREAGARESNYENERKDEMSGLKCMAWRAIPRRVTLSGALAVLAMALAAGWGNAERRVDKAEAQAHEAEEFAESIAEEVALQMEAAARRQ